MIVKVLHLITGILLAMLCVMVMPIYLPQVLTSLGWDLSNVCHQILERLYPVFYAICGLAELGTFLIFVKRRNEEASCAAGHSSTC